MTDKPTPSNSNRRTRLILLVIVVGVLGLLLIGGVTVGVLAWRLLSAPTVPSVAVTAPTEAAPAHIPSMAAPGQLDLATTKLTEQGNYRATTTARIDPIAINQIHQWVIRVETPDGQPVADAQIKVDGGMPEHGHGLPTHPQVTRYLGQGNYLVEGMKFNMPGWWTLKFEITTQGRTETVTFNLTLT
jgi:hypothetical protein